MQSVLARFANLLRPFYLTIRMGIRMRARRVIGITVVCYVVLCAIVAIFPGELAFRPQRVHVNERQSAEAIAARFGATLQDVSVTASDGSHLPRMVCASSKNKWRFRDTPPRSRRQSPGHDGICGSTTWSNENLTELGNGDEIFPSSQITGFSLQNDQHIYYVGD